MSQFKNDGICWMLLGSFSLEVRPSGETEPAYLNNCRLQNTDPTSIVGMLTVREQLHTASVKF